MARTKHLPTPAKVPRPVPFPFDRYKYAVQWEGDEENPFCILTDANGNVFVTNYKKQYDLMSAGTASLVADHDVAKWPHAILHGVRYLLQNGEAAGYKVTDEHLRELIDEWHNECVYSNLKAAAFAADYLCRFAAELNDVKRAVEEIQKPFPGPHSAVINDMVLSCLHPLFDPSVAKTLP